MPKPEPLPLSLPSRFTVAEARQAGVSRARLRVQSLRVPFHGVRVALSGAADHTDDLLASCLDYAPRLRPWQFLSHETALALVGVPMPEWPYRPALHVSAHRPAREPRVAGATGHRLQLREPATLHDAHGLPIEHPVRAWRQAGTLWSLGDLVAAGDFLISGQKPLATVAELRAEVDALGDVRGILRHALTLVRVGVRSPRETKLRLALRRAGLPEPDVAWILRASDGAFVAELDLAYPRWGLAVEYDGRVHAEDLLQFQKDADRWDRIRATGWEHVRVLNHHLAGSGAVAVAKVRDGLIRCGWRPGH